MFLFAFSTYARIGELAYTSSHASILQLDDVTFMASGKQVHEVKVCFRHFKHNLMGLPHFISYEQVTHKHCPVRALLEYLKFRGSKAKPLFCDTLGKAISRSIFDSQLRAALRFCGLNSSSYKGHSFRIGAASWDAENGVPDSQICLRGRWKSDAFKKYIRVATN